MKQWVSCFAILLGLLILSPVKAHAYATAYGEAYIDLSSLNISVYYEQGNEGNIVYDSSKVETRAYFDSVPTGEQESYWNDWGNGGSDSYENLSSSASIEPYGFSNTVAQSEVNYVYYYGYYDGYTESKFNVNSNEVMRAAAMVGEVDGDYMWGDSEAESSFKYYFYVPENGSTVSFDASVNYHLNLDLSTTSLGDMASGYVSVTLDFTKNYYDYCNWTQETLEKELGDGEIYSEYVEGTLWISGKLSPGDYGVLTFKSWASGSSTSPVPLPSTILLLGSGMLWMVGYRRKCLNKKC